MATSFISTKQFDIQLPTQSNLQGLNNILNNLDKLLIDIILYLAYGIAIVSGFKFTVNIINGFTTDSYMGT